MTNVMVIKYILLTQTFQNYDRGQDQRMLMSAFG